MKKEKTVCKLCHNDVSNKSGILSIITSGKEADYVCYYAYYACFGIKCLDTDAIMVYRIPLHITGEVIQFLLQAVLLHYIAKIHANIHWDLNSLTLSIEPEYVFQYYCTRNIAARRRHLQFYYKYIAFYSAYVYRIEKYRIAAKNFNTYRIVRHAYRYTPSHECGTVRSGGQAITKAKKSLLSRAEKN